jgi:RimJ/RimL family protein N-acetyltransferase
MGIAEVLLHAHDMAEGLGLPYEAPAHLAEFVLTRIFPTVQPGPDHWKTLLWATGRADLPGRARLAEWRWTNNLVLDTERLRLEGVTPAAAADLGAGGTGGFDWIEGGPFEGTRDAAGMMIKAYEAGVHRPEFGLFVLVRREDDRAVGGMGFHGVPDEEGKAEVGYDLAEAARGNGYATEALRTLAQRALARDDVQRLFAVVDRVNTPSQGVITRAGFTRVSEDEEQFAYELRP